MLTIDAFGDNRYSKSNLGSIRGTPREADYFTRVIFLVSTVSPTRS
jgi:hypothetical protein